jgi:WD40 repeat protein
LTHPSFFFHPSALTFLILPQVTIGCQWHPIDASRFATCSWDGTIKYWD